MAAPSCRSSPDTEETLLRYFTHGPERGFAIAREYRTGSIAINGMVVHIEMPFAGFKQSGLGRKGGIDGLETYLDTKTVYFT